jgi:hypothetical protein
VLVTGGATSDEEFHEAAAGSARSEPVSPPKKPEREETESTLPEMSCPPELTNCEVATGTVLYVEAVDPDGDGDAHFVTASKQGVTLPGITIFDVRTDLRPDPLPGVGDLVGGAGPVYPGHAGQKQIQVDEFHVAR